jgi:hypothetical protein
MDVVNVVIGRLSLDRKVVCYSSDRPKSDTIEIACHVRINGFANLLKTLIEFVWWQPERDQGGSTRWRD